MRRSLLAGLCALFALSTGSARAQAPAPPSGAPVPPSGASRPSPAPKPAARPGRAAAPAKPAADAREQDQEEDADQDTGETQGMEVQSEDSGQSADKRGSAPGEVHTIQHGDTLWDLSQRFLGTPWYWPKVWSYNPEIANPHWIYPGNVVRFFPAGEEVPSQIEAGPAPLNAGRDSLGLVPSVDAIPTDVVPGVQVMGKLTYTPKKETHLIRDGFVTPRELDEAGIIDSSFAETWMLSYPDTVYVHFKKKSDVHLGDRYLIFHTAAEVIHPLTGARYGYLTKILGTLKVINVSHQLVTAQIVDSYDEINRSDLVGPANEKLEQAVPLRPNTRQMKGYVIGSVVPGMVLYAEQHKVFIDKGNADGVEPGNTFTVIRQGNLGGDFINPAQSNDPRYPTEDVATCMAVDVKEKATTCLLIRSLREVMWGDRVEMRLPSGPAAPVSRR